MNSLKGKFATVEDLAADIDEHNNNPTDGSPPPIKPSVEEGLAEWTDKRYGPVYKTHDQTALFSATCRCLVSRPIIDTDALDRVRNARDRGKSDPASKLRAYLPAVWGGILRALPLEVDAPYNEAAARFFRDALFDFLKSPVRLGHAGQMQTRTLPSWCVMATGSKIEGQWKRLRSFDVWCVRHAVDDYGLAFLPHAFHINRNRLLELPDDTIAPLMKKYNLGKLEWINADHRKLEAIVIDKDISDLLAMHDSLPDLDKLGEEPSTRTERN